MSTSIDYIRNTYKVPAKIGKVVTYRGQKFRIAWTKGSGLLLRSEIIVHPTDPELAYSEGEVTENKTSDQIKNMLEKITPGSWRIRDGNPKDNNEVCIVRGIPIYGDYAAVSCGDEARFIAAAPDIVRQQMARIQELESENKRLREQLMAAQSEAGAWHDSFPDEVHELIDGETDEK
jgi:hypothetical protein